VRDEGSEGDGDGGDRLVPRSGERLALRDKADFAL